MSSIAPGQALLSIENGSRPFVAFDDLFKPLAFTPIASARNPAAYVRDNAITLAMSFFNAIKPAHMENAYQPAADGAGVLKNQSTPNGTTTFFLPAPLISSKNKARRKERNDLLLLRMDIPDGSIVTSMQNDQIASYFKACDGLGTPVSGAKWVWLTRCIAKNQYIVVPYTSSDNTRWATSLPVGGSLDAQVRTENGGSFVVPGVSATGQENKEFWAMLYSGIKEADPIPDLTHLEASIRADLVPPSPSDMTVPVFMVPSYRVSDGGYSTETRDAPARNKPSAVAEIAGAVAVAAAVSLVTGVVAAVV